MTNHKRNVKALWWNGANGDSVIHAKEGAKMVFQIDVMGDHELNWVCVYDAEGNEIARHNTRYIASIEWD